MLRDIPDISSQPFQPATVGDISAPRSSCSWLDESWRVSMSDSAKLRPETDATAKDHRDLCGICMYGSECMHRGTAEHPKIYCELFDVDVKAFSLREDDDPLHCSNREEHADLTGGLCCNCEHRKDCTIRMSKGNVWHCEEYC